MSDMITVTQDMAKSIVRMSGTATTLPDLSGKTVYPRAVEYVERALRFVHLANTSVGAEGDIQFSGDPGSRNENLSFDARLPPSAIAEAAPWIAALWSSLNIWAETADAPGYGLLSGVLRRPHDEEIDDFRSKAEKMAEHLRLIGFMARVVCEDVAPREIWSHEKTPSTPARKGKSGPSTSHYFVRFCAPVDETFTDDDEFCDLIRSLLDFGFKTEDNFPEPLPIADLHEMIGDEDPATLIARTALSRDKLQDLADRWVQVGRDINLFKAFIPSTNDDDERVKFLVPGLVPRGELTFLIGASGTGKSTLAHELAVAACGGDQETWLGQPVEKVKGLCVYLAGEDSAESVKQRAKNHLDPKGIATRVLTYPSSGQTIQAILDALQIIPGLDLLILDPLRYYLKGDEDSSESMNLLLIALQDFVRKRGCSGIVLHHLKKNIKPRSLQGVLEGVRGSQLLHDRARVIVGMYRRDDQTVVGLCKHAFPPSCGMMTEPRTFRRDAVTLRHVLTEQMGTAGRARRRDETAAGETTTLPDRIVSAMREVIERGGRVVRTGPHELFQLGLEGLQGVSRAKVRAAVQELVDAGRVRIQEDGALALVE